MIAVSHKYKLIHVHIPKTGGSSANDWMRELDPETESLGSRPHEPVTNITRDHAFEFSNYFTFAIVRNPWARSVSLFHYRKKATDHQPPHWPSRANIDSLSFREVVLRSEDQSPNYADVCPPRDAPETAWLEPSCFAWINLGGSIAVDHVCRLETIEQDIRVLSKILGLNTPPFPHTNQSDHRHYSEYYDDRSKSIVTKKYQKDIAHFGYHFNDKY